MWLEGHKQEQGIQIRVKTQLLLGLKGSVKDVKGSWVNESLSIAIGVDR
jgi:hypothetical protein